MGGPVYVECSYYNNYRLFPETNTIRIFVLDEADEMLSRGFKDQIHDVFKNLNSEVQVCLLLNSYNLYEPPERR